MKYTLNVLPGMSEEDGTLMDTIGNTEELSIFESKTLITYIEFKWDSYAAKIHRIGAVLHLIYLIAFSCLVNVIYVYKSLEHRELLFSVMILSLLYPTVYETI